MSPTPKTIQIFLPGGDPQGIRVAEITTRIIQAIEVPRSLLDEFCQMPESDQVALYFLCGQTDDADPRVYVGQTGDLRARLIKHNRDKDFWERALVVISRTHSLTQTHAVFLEWYCLRECRAARRYTDENGNSGTKPHTPPPLEADCLEIFDTTKTLIATLGFPLFVPVVRSEDVTDSHEIYQCTRSGAAGRGIYTPEGFVVLKGSAGPASIAGSLTGHSYENLRQELLKAGVCAVAGDTFVFQKDHLFRKPSQASTVILGRPSNGWTEWKTKPV
jgi:hypothetical protein